MGNGTGSSTRWGGVTLFMRKLQRRALRDTFGRWARSRSYRRVWIDVGAHEGELTFPFAAVDPSLLVYAFEPNLHAASRIMGRLRNYVVLPVAVAQRDGSAELQLNTFMNEAGIESVDYLKNDAQGLDLEVVKSAGDRLRHVAKVQLEATTVSYRQYEGAPGKSEIIEYMESKRFRLAGEEVQSHGQEANLT